MSELQSSSGGGEGKTNGVDKSTYKNAKLIDKLKKGRCVMQVDAINFETAGLWGKGKQTDSFCLEQEKRKAADRLVITGWEEHSLSGY